MCWAGVIVLRNGPGATAALSAWRKQLAQDASVDDATALLAAASGSDASGASSLPASLDAEHAVKVIPHPVHGWHQVLCMQPCMDEMVVMELIQACCCCCCCCMMSSML